MEGRCFGLCLCVFVCVCVCGDKTTNAAHHRSLGKLCDCIFEVFVLRCLSHRVVEDPDMCEALIPVHEMNKTLHIPVRLP